MAAPLSVDAGAVLPVGNLRKNPPARPLFSDAEAARHFLALSRLDELGDQPGVAAALPPQFLTRHPAVPDDTAHGFLACLHELQEMLRAASRMTAVSLAPQTEWQSMFACMAMIRAYHSALGDRMRTEILLVAPVNDRVADAAAQCGYALHEIAVSTRSVVDAAALRAAVGPRTAALLITSACASEAMEIVRAGGGLVCCFGAISVAGALGADLDLLGFPLSDGEHEVRAWAVAASKPLVQFLPLPVVGRTKDEYRLLAEKDLPLSIGRLGASPGNADALLHAYLRARMHEAAADSAEPALKS